MELTQQSSKMFCSNCVINLKTLSDGHWLLLAAQSCMEWDLDCEESWALKELMLLTCGVGEDFWESLGLKGDPASPF